MKILLSIFAMISIIALVSCGSTQEASKESKPGDLITLPSGLQYVDINVGNGPVPTEGQVCKVHYHGTLLDGSVFDSSVERGQPFEFKIGVGQVIKGWDEGVMTMKVGGKRKLIIPPSMAYGSRSAGKIPANSTLIFEVELLEVK